MIDTIGSHLLIEMFGCNPDILDSLAQIESVLLHAAEAAKATPVGSRFHRFQPNGTSGILLLAESHISIHTWPDEGYAAIDFFTCGDCKPKAGIPILEQELEAQGFEIMEVSRGHLHNPNAINVLKHERFQSPKRFEKKTS